MPYSTGCLHLSANKTTTEFATNPYDVNFISAGIAAPIQLVADSNLQQDFSFSIRLKGYEQLNLQPFANKTKIELRSPWSIPSFTGRILPDNQVTEKGFTATWNIMDVRKTLPDRFTDDYATPAAAENTMGVKLLQGQDHYSKTDRSIKYALLIITLTFVVYVFIELLQKKRINAAQYILVGAALLIFYTLLLSFSEYIGFDLAYAIAALAVVLQISIYTGMVFRSAKAGFVFGVLISVLYVFIFSLIQLEDYALLAGSVGLFFILSLVMFFSRKIAWTKNEKEEQLILKEENNEGPDAAMPN